MMLKMTSMLYLQRHCKQLFWVFELSSSAFAQLTPLQRKGKELCNKNILVATREYSSRKWKFDGENKSG